MRSNSESMSSDYEPNGIPFVTWASCVWSYSLYFEKNLIFFPRMSCGVLSGDQLSEKSFLNDFVNPNQIWIVITIWLGTNLWRKNPVCAGVWLRGKIFWKKNLLSKTIDSFRLVIWYPRKLTPFQSYFWTRIGFDILAKIAMKRVAMSEDMIYWVERVD